MASKAATSLKSEQYFFVPRGRKLNDYVAGFSVDKYILIF